MSAKIPRTCVTAAAILGVGLAASALAATGQPKPLSGDAIHEIVVSSTIHLHTPLGTTVPIVHHENGTVTGKAGAVSWFLGASKDNGKWWITGSKLCHQWKIWFKGKPNCMVIRRRGTKFAWVQDDGESGIASIVPRNKPTRYAKKTMSDPVGVAGPLPRHAKKPAPRLTQVRTTTPAAAATATPRLAHTRSAKINTTAIRPKAAHIVPPLPSGKPGSPTATRLVRAKTNRPSYRVVGVQYDDVLNMRREPTEYAPIIGQLAPDLRGVRKTGKCFDSWCPVEHASQSGWVNRFFLKRERSKNSNNKRYRVIKVDYGDVLYMRLSADQSAPVVGTIPPRGKGVKITGRCSGDWCPIQHKRKNGWVNRAYIAPEGQSTANVN